MTELVFLAAHLGLVMLVWDCVEVGRNDAANLVNAVFGSRVMTRRLAVAVAGTAVVLGAVFASPVMETVRRGIFDPSALTLEAAITVYISVYVVDTVLLYSLSAFGMPVSTTASLVFELVGAAFGVTLVAHGWSDAIAIVAWDTVGQVLVAIVVSIFLSGFAGFVIQRAVRGAVREDAQNHQRVLLHGPWIAGLMLTWLSWFLVLKGLKSVGFVAALRSGYFDHFGVVPALAMLWLAFALMVFGVLTALKERGTRYLFHAMSVLGMVALAFAFGQNDLANCASPGLSAWWLYQHSGEAVSYATELPLPRWALFGCGLLMAAGMSTASAQRVTRAEVNTGSQHDEVALWAPDWTRRLARLVVRPDGGPQLAPAPTLNAAGKRVHYDTLRAAVITSVSASVIAFASSRGLPVSTTYVAFAAVIATGWGDRVFARGGADLKLGRAIWVGTSWFLAGAVAVVAAAVVAVVVFQLGSLGLLLTLGTNLGLRAYFKRRADAHEQAYHLAVRAAGTHGDTSDD
jgi:phosphate/sulfate permease